MMVQLSERGISLLLHKCVVLSISLIVNVQYVINILIVTTYMFQAISSESVTH